MLLELLVISQLVLSVDPLTGYAPNVPANGLRYYPSANQSVELELRFRADPTKVNASAMVTYGCGFTPSGWWLMDEYNINTYVGNRMITVSRSGDLCVVLRPTQGGTWQTVLSSQVLLDGSENTLTLSQAGGVVYMTLNGVTDNISPGFPMSFTSGSNGIGVATETNGYHNLYGNDSWPGDITYMRDNGVDPLAIGSVTGSAQLIDNGNPPPPPGPCEIDPDSFECACETNNWPECMSCQAP